MRGSGVKHYFDWYDKCGYQHCAFLRSIFNQLRACALAAMALIKIIAAHKSWAQRSKERHNIRLPIMLRLRQGY